MTADEIVERLKGSEFYSILLEQIVAEAERFWHYCPSDFVLQHTSFDYVVFGSTNRVVWSVKHGFKCERSYCTQQFIERFDQLMGR